MQVEIIRKVKGLINISNKAGYLIIGSDALKNYHKKLYLIIRSSNSGKNLVKISENLVKQTNCEEIILTDEEMSAIISIDNCKIIGLKNLGLSKEILKYIRGEKLV